MRKITEFKGYRSFTDYDTATGCFFAQRLLGPETRVEPIIEAVSPLPATPLKVPSLHKSPSSRQRLGDLTAGLEARID